MWKLIVITHTTYYNVTSTNIELTIDCMVTEVLPCAVNMVVEVHLVLNVEMVGVVMTLGGGGVGVVIMSELLG